MRMGPRIQGRLLCCFVALLRNKPRLFSISCACHDSFLNDVVLFCCLSWTIKATNPTEAWKITLHESNLIPNATSQQPSGGKCPFSGMTLPPDGMASVGEESKQSIPVEVATNGISVNETSNGNACPNPPNEPCISSRNMKKLFPYHVVINKAFEILQVGSSLSPLMGHPEKDFIGKKIMEVLIISRPVLGAWEWASLKKLEDQTFFVDPIEKGLAHVKSRQTLWSHQTQDKHTKSC